MSIRSCNHASMVRRLLTLFCSNQFSSVLPDVHCRALSRLEHFRFQVGGARLRRTAAFVGSQALAD